MSEYKIRQDIDVFEIADEYAKRVSRVVDEITLAKVERQLAEFGYVKVVRCRDCVFFDDAGEFGQWCAQLDFGKKEIVDGFCAWGEKWDDV